MGQRQHIQFPCNTTGQKYQGMTELMVPEASIFTLGFLCQHPPTGHSSLCCSQGFLSETNSYHVIALFGNPAWPLTASCKSHNSKDWQNQAFGTPSTLAVASHTTPPYSHIRAPAVRHVGLFTPCFHAFASAVPSAGKALPFFSMSHLFC